MGGMKTLGTYFPHLLLGMYVVVFIALGIAPYDRQTWIAENLPIVILVGIAAWHFTRQRLSNTSYLLMSVLVFLHTIGGHYTFERVPFGFVTELFGFERNHFDRVAHFSVGFWAYPIAEILLKRKLVRSWFLLLLFPVFTIASVAAGYEIIEWLYAVRAGGDAGAAFLGSQGDIWDAQKDMLADTLGAIVAVLLFWVIERNTADLTQAG
jgi:putative membrane protein